MENDKNIVQEQFDSLPPEIKEALNQFPWQERVKNIAAREGLEEEKSARLETEVMLVLYGFLPAESFQENLKVKVGIDNLQAIRIEEAVAQEIFEEIEENYQKTLETVKNNEPIIITTENKEEALEELSRRGEINKQNIVPSKPAGAHANLPMVEEGEVAHEVPHVEKVNNELGIKNNDINQEEKPKIAQVPNYSYPAGKDPYKEPLV
jgi:hypothetical protein